MKNNRAKILYFIISLFFILLYNTALSQNIDKNDFQLNVNFFEKDNNIPKYAIELNDCFIVAGQAFNKDNDLIYNSAIIKLSKDGKLIKKVFLGSEDISNRKSMKSVFLINNRIVQFGTFRKKNRSHLWLREIDSDLNVIKEFSKEEFENLKNTDVEYYNYYTKGLSFFKGLSDKVKKIYSEKELWYIYVFDQKLKDKLALIK